MLPAGRGLPFWYIRRAFSAFATRLRRHGCTSSAFVHVSRYCKWNPVVHEQ